MADPTPERRDTTRDEPPGEDASRPVGLALLLGVGAVMAALVAGLVWSTGHGLEWW